MIKSGNNTVGVCTWSLGNDFDKIGQLRQQLGLEHLHLATSPALAEGGQEYLAKVIEEGWKVTATMVDFAQEDYSSMESIKVTGGIVPEDCWDQNRQKVLDAIKVTDQLGVKYLTCHFGFIDQSNSEYEQRFADKVKELAGAADEKGVMLLMETGQETADELREFLEKLDHPALGVNLDPANMILYGKGDPIEAVGVLGPWIKHVHIKDALATLTAGTWGEEVVWGAGQVGSDYFLDALDDIDYTGALAIEREAGEKRLEDIIKAAELLIG